MNGQMQNQAPIPLAWWSFDLGDYRKCDGTYCRYDYTDEKKLPPLPVQPHVSESLDWLDPLDQRTDARMAIHRNPPEARGEVAKIATSAAQLGLTLPASFVQLMVNPALQNRIPSCTACYFKLSDEILPYPDVQGGHITRFLNDQQDVLLWYLYFSPEGAHKVLVTTYDLDKMARRAKADRERTDAPQPDQLTAQDRQYIRRNTWICEQSFAEFIYRWWLENTLWFKLDEGRKLTADEQKYLDDWRAFLTAE